MILFSYSFVFLILVYSLIEWYKKDFIILSCKCLFFKCLVDLTNGGTWFCKMSANDLTFIPDFVKSSLFVLLSIAKVLPTILILSKN